MYRRELLKLLGATPLVNTWKENIPLSHAFSRATPGAGKHAYDLAIYGATPGGIAFALRAAREGLKILLVNHNQHLGGMFVNGLGTMDTLYNGARAPIYDELRYNIYDYYRRKYGKKSEQFESSLPGFPKTRYESHVMEEMINELIGREAGISVLKDYYPSSAGRKGSILETVTFRHKKSEKLITVDAEIFADCSYEGDLAAVAGTPTRIGRESKQEFGERHAGITYMTKNSWPPPARDMDDPDFGLIREMNLFYYNSWSDLIMPQSTGEADSAVQAFNIRSTLTDDPANRIIPGRPRNYDPDQIRRIIVSETGAGLGVPNRKTSWNSPELIGEQNPYVEGDWAERDRITNKFKDATLGLLYFLQNDPSVDQKVREKMQQFGLAKDEYRDNENMPYEIYVREARRITGRAVFTENDALLVKGLKRAPVHADSISVTEWFMDSHACTEKTVEGSKPEGETMLKNKTFPGQVSFRCILPKDLENLMVPVCLSASHIGWGAIRLEPTWMSIGESAGYAASLAVKQKISPSSINSDQLLRILAEKGLMISFFNDVEGREYAPWYPAVQYLGTKGFFGTYEANPNGLLNSQLAEAWLQRARQWIKNRSLDPGNGATLIHAVEDLHDKGVTASSFAKSLAGTEGFSARKVMSCLARLGIRPDAPITRGDACRLIFGSSAEE